MKLLQIAIGLTILVGCSTTPQEIKDTYPVGEFASTKASYELTACLDKNVRKMNFGLHNTNVTPKSEDRFEILVLSGGSAFATLEIEPKNEYNSNAIIRLGGSARVTPKTIIRQITNGCS